MDLLIDGQALQTPSSAHRGIGRYARNLIHAIRAARPCWNIALVQNQSLQPVDPKHVAGLPVISFEPPLPIEPRHADANELYYADWLCARHLQCILILSTFEREAIIPWFVGARPKLVSVLYDLIPLVYAEHYLREPAAFAAYARQLRRLADADTVLAISEWTAQDFRRFAPNARGSAVNISGSTDSAFAPLAQDELD